jgi:DNA-binding LytR/AlgR family response regulator
MSIRVAICEDEAPIREEILRLAEGYGDGYVVDAYESGDALLAAGEQYDLYMLDIQMPGISGMELARVIREGQEYPGPMILFITAMGKRMQEAFDVQAYHFLVKPLNEEKFHSVFTGAIRELERRQTQEQIIIKHAGVTHSIPLGDILFVESDKKKVVLQTRTGSVEYYGKISEFEERPHFFRCHRCYIVNMEHIVRYNGVVITLTDGQEVSISRKLYPEFIKAYLAYAMN